MLAQIRDPPAPAVVPSSDAAVDALSASATGPMPTSFSSRDVGALYGYASSLLNLCYVLQPTHVAACLDLGSRQSFRHALFPEYKSERKPIEDSLRWQLGHLSRVTRALGIEPVTAPGFEADDIIGTLAHAASRSGADTAAAGQPVFDRVVILSSDKDFIQCVNDRVSILSPKQGGSGGGCYVWLHADEVDATVGVRPDRFADYLVLLGDTVDGIPGVPGIGPVRAKSIVDHYASLEQAMHDVHTKHHLKGDKKGKTSDRVYTALREAEKNLPMWRELATIRTDVPGLPVWDQLRYHGPTNGAAASDKPNSSAARAIAAAAAEAAAALPLTDSQQLHAAAVTALYREFSFPALPSFVPPVAESTQVAAAAAAAAASRSTAAAASPLPRLLSQAQWAALSVGRERDEAPVVPKTPAAKKAKTSVKKAAKHDADETATAKPKRIRKPAASHAPPTGLSVEQLDDEFTVGS